MNKYKPTILIGFSLLLHLNLYFFINQIGVTNYEISIFNNISLYVILIFIFINVLNLYFILNFESKFFSIFGLLSLYSCCLILLVLPIIKGYAMYGRGDSLTQLGYTLDILNEHIVTYNNIYPMTHLLEFSILSISSITPQKIRMSICLIYISLYVFSIYLLSNKLFATKYISLISCLVCPIVFLSPMGYPQETSLFFIPFISLILLKYYSKKTSTQILLIILILTLPFYHPLTEFLFISSLIFYQILHYVLNTTKRQDYNFMLVNIILISSIVYLIWVINNDLFWSTNMQRLINSIIGVESYTSRTSEVLNIFNEYQLSFFDTVLKMYGHVFVFVIISVFGLLIFLKNNQSSIQNYMFIISWIFICGFMGFFSAFGAFFRFDPSRMILPCIMFLPLFFGYCIHYFNNKYSGYPFKILLSLLILFLLCGSYLTTLDDPYVSLPNQQVSMREISGTGWLVEHKSPSYEILITRNRYSRIVDGIYGTYGTSVKKSHLNIGDWYDPNHEVADHFGFNTNNVTYLSDKFNNYLIISKYDLDVFTVLFPNLDKFNQKDFARISQTRGINKIYETDGFDILFIS